MSERVRNNAMSAIPDDPEQSTYRFIIVAAKRARQLQNGSGALVQSQSTKPCRIAQEEISAGKIAYEKTEAPVVKPLIEGPAVPILLS